MRKLSTREVVLLVIVAIAGLGYLWYARGGSSPLDELGAVANAAGAYNVKDAPVVPLGLLETATDSYDSQGRDLFKYSKPPVDPNALERQRLATEARDRATEERRKRQQAPQKPQKRVPTTPQPPGIPLKYIGYLGPKDDRIAVFEDGEDLILARTGETLQEQFRVVEIRYESVVMGFTDEQWLNRTREINMSAQ